MTAFRPRAGVGRAEGPPTAIGPMARREMRLAYTMLLPTFVIVFGIVLAPLLANFWISLKPIQLGDLRPPALVVNERLRGRLEAPGDTGRIEYRIRNSSQKEPLRQAQFSDAVPVGLQVDALDDRCSLAGVLLDCELGVVPPKYRDRIRIEVTATEAYFKNEINPRVSRPTVFAKADNILTNFQFTLDNYREIFAAEEFWYVLRVSIYYTVFGTAGAVVLGLFAAQLLNTAFPGRGVLRGLFLFPYVAPVIAVAFTWVVLFDPFSGTLNSILLQMGAIDEPINFFGQRVMPFNFFGFTLEFPLALSSVIAFEAWRYFPLSFLFILARMQSLSSEIYEAAEIDGATPLQQFWNISLPQLVGILSVLFLLRFIWTFNKFDDIFLLTGGAAGTRTLTVDVYEQAFGVANLGAGAAVAVIVFVVLLIFSLIFFKFAPQDDG
ncbi:MAG: carbohydrate ABC transporter permease [Hyphomicrobiaceae bacterium]